MIEYNYNVRNRGRVHADANVVQQLACCFEGVGRQWCCHTWLRRCSSGAAGVPCRSLCSSYAFYLHSGAAVLCLSSFDSLCLRLPSVSSL